jgi:hypothetical protein
MVNAIHHISPTSIHGRNDAVGGWCHARNLRGEIEMVNAIHHIRPYVVCTGGHDIPPSIHGRDILQRHSMGTIVPVESPCGWFIPWAQTMPSGMVSCMPWGRIKW